MPRNPTLEERIQWHRAHSKHCACRPMPERVLAEIEKRKAKLRS